MTRKNQDLVSELPLTISAQYGLIDQNEFFDKRVASKDVSGYYLIYNGEFAYNKSTSTDAPWGAIKRLDKYENGVLSTLYIVFKIRNEEEVNSDFLVTYYDTSNWHKDIQAIAAEGARNHGLLNIAPADFFKTELMMPQDIDEQKKIGDYFKSLNDLITLHQRKCDETKKLKKYMLQKMFPQKNEKKPEIRFAGFTDDWEQRKLGDIITEYKETVDSDCTLPILTSSKTEGVILQEKHFGRKQQHDITGYNILPRNYCTYRNRSDGVDFTFNINKCCDKGIISKFYPVFSGKNSDVFFLSLVLNNSEEVVREIAYTCTGTGQKVLSFLDLQKMKVRVPNFDEQKEIVAYFESLDHLITLHQRKCDETKKLKKFMLQKMFPKKDEKKPEIRFAGFTDDWEQRKLPEFVTFFNGLTYTPDDVEETGTLVLRSSNVKNGEIVDADNVYVNDKVVTSENVQEGDIIVVVRNGSRALIGKHAQIKDSMPNTVIGAFMSGMRSEHSSFVNALLDTSAFENEIAKNMGATINQITGYMFSRMEFMIPSGEEQQKIGEYFQGLDDLITLHQRKCDEIKEIKKFMLQNMFPQKG